MKTSAKHHIIALTGAATLVIFPGCQPFDNINDNPPDAKFSYTSEILFPAHVQFQNTSVSAGGTAAYVWDFGDGSTSTIVDPSHDYASPGTYNVKLVQMPATGSNDTLIKALQLSPATGPSGNSNRQNTAGFNFVVNYGGYLVSFINSSQYGGAFQWNFGDGGTSTTDSVLVKHTYTTPGTYHVVLTAQGINANDTSGATITF